MKRLKPYRLPLYLLLLLGCLLFSQAASAQVGDPDRVLKTEKQKKKPKKKKRKDPDHSPRKRVWELIKPAPKVDHMPGDFGAEGKLPQNDDRYQPELNGDKPMTKWARKKHRPTSTTHQGNVKVKKGSVQEPGVHHSERSEKDAKQARSARGTDHQGGIKVKERDVSKPGEVYNEEDRLKASRRRNMHGTNDQGRFKVKQKDVYQPGQVYNQEDRQKAVKRKKLSGTDYGGHAKVKTSEMIEPGTHHSERNEKAGQRYSSYKASRHGGNNTVKTKYVREPGVHWSERKSSFAKQYNSTEAASHAGNIRGMSKRQKAHHYSKLSGKVHQHEGTIKISRQKQADMHPSVVARKAPGMRSLEQKDKARNRSRWLNRIFKNKQQPKSVKAKDQKPRYDKGESTIWND